MNERGVQMFGDDDSAVMRVRLGSNDTHYASNLVPGATLLRLLADCGNALTLKEYGQSGFLAAWHEANFRNAAFVGDYVDVECRIIERGNRSKKIHGRVSCVIRSSSGSEDGRSAGQVLAEPLLLVEGVYVSVMPRAS